MNFRAFKNSRRGLWVGRGLVVFGSIVTLCLVYFNGKHGWSLGHSWDEQVALSILHGAVDPITALLVSAAAIAAAWRYRFRAVAILLVALVFTSFSMLTTAGFMSNRLAGVVGQKATLAELEKQGKWWNSTTYKRDLTRGEKLANRAELRATFKERLKVVAQVPDPQAAQLSEWTGWGIERSQRLINLFSASIGQTLKYMALLVGFFLLANRDETSVDTASDTGNSGSDGGGKSKDQDQKQPDTRKVMQADTDKVVPIKKAAGDTAHTVNNSRSISVIQPTQRSLDPVDKRPTASAKLSAAERDAILRRDLMNGAMQPQRAYRELTGWSQPTIHRSLKKLRGQKRHRDRFHDRRPFVHHGGVVSLSG